jgi:HAD superfamily hydrolase (TIGR01549 family)
MIRHVSFDFDGVLAQGSNEAYIDSYHRALTQVGVTLDPALERQLILDSWGLPAGEQVEILLKDHPDKISEATKYFFEARLSPAFRAQVALFAGAEETIRTLKDKYILSIVSGADRALIESVLGPELKQMFANIYCCSDYEPHLQKPSPHMLNLAMAGAGIEAAETVYIGDAPNDLRMAKAAGAEPIAILTGHLTRSSASELGARYILDDITEFPDVLASL